MARMDGMRVFKQWELTSALYGLWLHFPEWRFGQFVENLTGTVDAFYVADEDIMGAIKAVYANEHPRVTIP